MNNVLLICQYLSHCSACPWFSGGCQNSVLIASPKPVGACQHLLILGYDVIALLSLPLSLRYTCTSFDTFPLPQDPLLPIRPSNPLNSSPLARKIRLLLTIVRVYKLYLLTYSLIAQ